MRITSKNQWELTNKGLVMREDYSDTGGEISDYLKRYQDHASEQSQKSREFWANDRTANHVTRPAPAPVVVPTIPLADQLTFWNYLNDIQYVTFDPAALTKQNTWLLTGKGSWLIQKNSTGYYGVKKDAKGIPTLPKAEYPEAFFELAFGKLPNTILEQIVAFFREIMKRHNDAEAFIQVYWDRQESRYVVHVPKQRISKAAVNYDALENLNNKDSARYVFVYECHSHNSMNAFWSGTDNADEKELRIYGVFGQLNKDDYACKHRFFVGEEQVDLELSHVFETESSVEKQYLVTHNNKQHLVRASKLQLDEKPKYILENDAGEKQYVPLESVVLYRTKVEFPETWFANINVPLPQTQRPITQTWNKQDSLFNKPNFGQKDKKDRKAKSFERNTDTGFDPRDPFAYSEEGIYEQVIAETAQEITDNVSDLLDLTNGFDDLTTTLMFIEELEAANVLYELHNKISEYIGEYPVEAANALP
jgi:PRTRC genetic system protein A